MAYFEIKCIEPTGKGQTCGRFLGDLNEDSEDGNFRCPRCQMVWNVRESVKGSRVLLYRKMAPKENKDYLDNAVRIEERVIDNG